MWKAQDLTSFKSDLMFLQATPRPYEEMPTEEKFQACYFCLNCWNSMDIMRRLTRTALGKAVVQAGSSLGLCFLTQQAGRRLQASGCGTASRNVSEG